MADAHFSNGERSWRLLPPMQPPFESASQQRFYDDIVSGAIGGSGAKSGIEGIIDDEGALQGPWQVHAMVADLGRSVLQLAKRIADDNTGEKRVRAMPILVTAAYMQSELVWYVHSRLALKENVSEEALPLMKELAPAESLQGKLKHDELAVYKMFRELVATNRVTDNTYKAALEVLDNDRKKIASLVLSMGCYYSVAQRNNLFGVPTKAGAFLEFPVDGKTESLPEPHMADAHFSNGERSW